MKMANKGKPKFPTFFLIINIIKIIKKIIIFLSWILMKNIQSWSKFSQEFNGIDEKSQNPQLRGLMKRKNQKQIR